MEKKERIEYLRRQFLEPDTEWGRSRVERVMTSAAPLPGERLLDLGCAAGTFGFFGQQAGAEATGIDRDRSILIAGRQAVLMSGGSVPLVQADATAIPVRSSVFDLVVNADFIEHIDELTKATVFREMFRVLKPGARAVVYTPNRNRKRWAYFASCLRAAFGRGPRPGTWLNFITPEHFGLSTPARVRRQLIDAGFVVQMEFHDFNVPLLSRWPRLHRRLQFSALLVNLFADRFLASIVRPQAPTYRH